MGNIRVNFQYFRQNAEKILIILFLAAFSFNIRKVFLTPYSFLDGTFNEYLTPSLGWADFLMLAVIIIYTIKWLYSQFVWDLSDNSLLDHVIRFISSVIQCLNNVSRETLLLTVFIFWMGISISWSQNKAFALYRFSTFLEILVFSYISIKSLKNSNWIDVAFLALIINGLFQSILGSAQFFLNRSVGIHWMGESILASNIEGVAKIIIRGEKHIRAYGTFPHPNILAGFLIITIFFILSLLLKRLVFAKNNMEVSRGTFFYHIPTQFLVITFAILLMGLLLTFSRSAIIGLLLGLILGLLWFRKLLFKKIFRREIIVLIFILIISVTFFAQSHINATSIFSTQSLEERNLYQRVSYETISHHPLTGIGIGQFVFGEFKKYPDMEGWQYQPVHNIYLLVFSELGIVGVIFLLLFFSVTMRPKINRKSISYGELTYLSFYCIIFSFLFISLFDHYFWDIKLGMIVFFIPIIFLKLSAEKFFHASMR
jgi:O-antigen ligase